MGKEKIFLIGIILLGLVLRFIGISQSLWLDEASQAQLSVLSVEQIWSGRGGDFQPPLFYLLAHYWLQLGRSEVWLRLLPLAFGIMNILVLYFLARELFPEQKIQISKFKFKIGLVTAFLLAINPFHVYYSQEFRMYSLLALLGTLSMYGLVKKNWWLFGVNALILYTHYAGVFLLISQLVYVLLWEKKLIKYLSIQAILSLVLYLPWIPQFIRQLNSGINIDVYLPGWRSILALDPIKALPLTVFKLIAGRIDFVSPIFYSVYLSVVLVLVGVAGFLTRQHVKLLLVWFLLPLLLAWAVSFVLPLNQPFRLIFVLPAIILMLSQAVSKFPRTFLLLLLYISIAGLVMTYTRPRLKKEQWRQTAAFLEAKEDAKSSVVLKFSANLAPLEWYAPNLAIVPAVPSFPAQIQQVSTKFNQVNLKENVYVIDYLGELTDPYNSVGQSLTELSYQEQDVFNFEGVGLIHWYTKKL